MSIFYVVNLEFLKFRKRKFGEAIRRMAYYLAPINIYIYIYVYIYIGYFHIPWVIVHISEVTLLKQPCELTRRR